MSEAAVSKSDIRDVASASAKSVNSGDGVEGPKKASDTLEWTTSRWELWSFYLYYVVSYLSLRYMNMHPRTDGHPYTPEGKQRTVWLQFRSLAISESAVSGWIRSRATTIYSPVREWYRMCAPFPRKDKRQ